MRRTNTESIGAVIQKFLRLHGLETPLNERRLIDAWATVVGTPRAAYTKDLIIRNQTLYVSVGSAALRQELSMERSNLVRRLNEKVGATVITDIVFR
jgi:predicted nucleic acid-binding Zn ribbon protein